MNFLRKFLVNLLVIIVGFAIVYFLAPDLWHAAFQLFIVLAGPMGVVLVILLVLMSALPRRRGQ